MSSIYPPPIIYRSVNHKYYGLNSTDYHYFIKDHNEVSIRTNLRTICFHLKVKLAPDTRMKYWRILDMEIHWAIMKLWLGDDEIDKNSGHF